MTDSDDAYQAAWNLLHERYGKPFVIAKAFRDKLHSWPKIASKESGDNEVLVYSLLDSQSDSSFILEEVADSLDANTEQVKLKLSTMSSKKTIVHCKRLRNLQVRGIFSADRITVPTTYTREFISANKKHIPTPETAKA